MFDILNLLQLKNSRTILESIPTIAKKMFIGNVSLFTFRMSVCGGGTRYEVR